MGRNTKLGWIGVDLDGTLAHYEGWDEGKIGKPIAPMVERVKAWRADGYEVRIMTARVFPIALVLANGVLPGVTDPNPRQIEASKAVVDIRRWCLEHLGEHLPVTCQKDYSMIELWDDRAVQVEINTGRVLGQPRVLR
jgi:hypothetical protein